MKKTLIVSYTPRFGSRTKQLLDCFLQEAQGKTEITHVDLVEETPDLLLQENLNVMLKRNFTNEVLSGEETVVLAKNDEMLQQYKAADFIVLVHSMHNFSLPAPVKAWFDAVLQPNQTFNLTEKGYEGLCEGTKAAVLMTTGGDFNLDVVKDMNFATGLTTTCFGITGIPSQHISAYGMNMYLDRIDEILTESKKEVVALVNDWYK